MEKLTKENIQFIDNYLLKSEVIYKDIRVEMVDHVANAVEERMQTENDYFYDAFKSYMLEHKADLLKQNDFSKKIYKSLFKEILLKSFSVNALIVFVLALAINFGIAYYTEIFQDKNNFNIVYLIILLVPIILTLLRRRYNIFRSIHSGERYSATTGLMMIIVMNYYMLNFVNIYFFNALKPYQFIFFSFLAVFTFNFCLLLNNYIIKYHKQYA